MAVAPMTDLAFWAIAAFAGIGGLGLIFAPLLRGTGPGGRRASYDMRVFRDQLSEIDSDQARGVLTEEEARATRLDISRRLLAADAEAGGEVEAGQAPRALSRSAAVGMALTLGLSGVGLYVWLGAPGMPDQPLRGRLEADAKARAERPGQEAVEAMVADQAKAPDAPAVPAAPAQDLALIEQLRTALAERPNDLQGHRLLARSLSSLSRWPEARAAQGDVIRILGPKATAADLVEWAELMVLATNGYVSPEAEAALSRGLTLDPGNALGRYYSGLALLQGGRPDLAYRLWTGLLAEGPAEAPWIPTIKAQIGEVARLAGLPPPEGATPAPGPGQADIDAAGEMTPEARQGMIESMVEQLATRLSSQGGSVEEWARLIRAYGVLGRVADAAQAWTAAKAAHGDPAATATLAAAAREAGLTN